MILNKMTKHRNCHLKIEPFYLDKNSDIKSTCDDHD